MNKVNKVLPLPDKNYILKKENNWRIELPKSYRNYLLQFNGGVPNRKTFVFNKYKYSVERFLSLLEDYKENELGDYDIGVVLTQIELRLTDNLDLIGVEKLPIAVLFAGDLICLDFKETPENPSVCIWYHEESGEFDPVTKKIANSFEEFLEMLK